MTVIKYITSSYQLMNLLLVLSAVAVSAQSVSAIFPISCIKNIMASNSLYFKHLNMPFLVESKDLIKAKDAIQLLPKRWVIWKLSKEDLEQNNYCIEKLRMKYEDEVGTVLKLVTVPWETSEVIIKALENEKIVVIKESRKGFDSGEIGDLVEIETKEYKSDNVHSPNLHFLDVDEVLNNDEDLEALVDVGFWRYIQYHFFKVTVKKARIPVELQSELFQELFETARSNKLRLLAGNGLPSKDDISLHKILKEAKKELVKQPMTLKNKKTNKNLRFNLNTNVKYRFVIDVDE